MANKNVYQPAPAAPAPAQPSEDSEYTLGSYGSTGEPEADALRQFTKIRVIDRYRVGVATSLYITRTQRSGGPSAIRLLTDSGRTVGHYWKSALSYVVYPDATQKMLTIYVYTSFEKTLAAVVDYSVPMGQFQRSSLAGQLVRNQYELFRSRIDLYLDNADFMSDVVNRYALQPRAGRRFGFNPLILNGFTFLVYKEPLNEEQRTAKRLAGRNFVQPIVRKGVILVRPSTSFIETFVVTPPVYNDTQMTRKPTVLPDYRVRIDTSPEAFRVRGPAYIDRNVDARALAALKGNYEPATLPSQLQMI